MTMFMICELREVNFMATLDNTKGATGQIARDSATGNLYMKHGGTWQQITTPGIGGTAVETSLAITVKNSAGTVSRSLTETNGIVNLASTDAIVSQGNTVTLNKSTGVASSGNATLNSPATVNVASGAVSNVQASA
jgi:hypothetical protein